MQVSDDKIAHAQNHIAAALAWADQMGLIDVGIHLNSALLALDEAQSSPQMAIAEAIAVSA